MMTRTVQTGSASRRKSLIGMAGAHPTAIGPIATAQWSPVSIKDRRTQRKVADGVSPAQIRAFIEHVKEIADEFNAASQRLGLGTRMCVKRLVKRVNAGDHAPVLAFCDGSEAGGRVYPNQVETMVRTHLSLVQNPIATHVIIGAMQSGKTGTAILLILHAVIFYEMTGLPLSPLYLLPDSIVQEVQMGLELERFMLFYGHVELRFSRDRFSAIPASAGDEWDALDHPPSLPLTSPTLDTVFQESPNLSTYLTRVLNVDTTADLIVRRSKGKRPLERQIARMYEHALLPMPVLDEVQYGASGTEKSDCMTARILTRIAEVAGGERAPRAIYTSATPFSESHQVETVDIYQRLPEDYCGITHFKGRPFPGHENARPLPLISFSEAATRDGLESIGQIDLGLYTDALHARMDIADLRKFARRCGYPITVGKSERVMSDYVKFVESGLTRIVSTLLLADDGLARTGEPRGLCIRLQNNNAAASELLDLIGFEDLGVDVIRYYGPLGQASLKQILRERPNPNRPYLIAVTARARQADAFPRNVEYYIDFVENVATINALLQGFAGRAMGAGKHSTVILSNNSVSILRRYIATHGETSIPATRHGYNIGEKTADRVRATVRLMRGQHPRIDAFLDEVQDRFVDRAVSTSADGRWVHLDKNKINRVMGRDVDKRIPILGLLREFALDDVLAENPGLVMDGFTGQARIARYEDQVPARDGTPYAYDCDADDHDLATVCYRTLGAKGGRAWREDVFRKGRAPTAKNIRDGARRSRDHLEPCIAVEVDADRRCTLIFIDLPLAETVRIHGRGTKDILPNERHFRKDMLAPCELLMREYRDALPTPLRPSRQSRPSVR
jgi:hypothetical protein